MAANWLPPVPKSWPNRTWPRKVRRKSIGSKNRLLFSSLSRTFPLCRDFPTCRRFSFFFSSFLPFSRAHTRNGNDETEERRVVSRLFFFFFISDFHGTAFAIFPSHRREQTMLVHGWTVWSPLRGPIRCSKLSVSSISRKESRILTLPLPRFSSFLSLPLTSAIALKKNSNYPSTSRSPAYSSFGCASKFFPLLFYSKSQLLTEFELLLPLVAPSETTFFRCATILSNMACEKHVVRVAAYFSRSSLGDRPSKLPKWFALGENTVSYGTCKNSKILW